MRPSGAATKKALLYANTAAYAAGAAHIGYNLAKGTQKTKLSALDLGFGAALGGLNGRDQGRALHGGTQHI